MMLLVETRNSDRVSALKVALDEALAFTPVRVAAMAPEMSAIELKNFADEEASFGRVTVDARGLTSGTKINIIEPWRSIIAAWQAARNQFDQTIEPKMADLRAVASLKSEIIELQEKRDRDLAQAENEWETKQQHQDIKLDRDDAERRFSSLSDNHGRRAPVMLAYHWSYKIALLFIGISEWLINYETFLLFLGVPAIAAGATLILGVLLAYAAHSHGILLKQWSYHFGAHQERMKRTSAYRLFALSTIGLLIVLTAAGGSRYAAALDSLSAQPIENILGNAATIEINPLRDVLISLLANLGAWAVGVFVSYFFHDIDPDFMDAKRERLKTARRHYSVRRYVQDKKKTIEASVAKQVSSMELAASTRSASVAREQAMLDQVNKQETLILNTVASRMRAKAEQYRDNLAQLAVAARGGVVFTQTIGGEEKTISPYDYRAHPVKIDLAFLKEMMG
jgi:hypothetical protein